ncbi:serine/arginine-rich splicing factor 4-like [Vigna umbellata]|uniref:serine/arginine-rich splicing factor 4-like n=1 Tax=Vigna umbellata TaxID=87088 RepID=UPI001F5FD66B|nr:serine/arginine-rich splicing factor 4-like [Vigna umbellata]XP_047168289.1 serine/arginine-rich splicing factor 4-like [Vigna umbellata]
MSLYIGNLSEDSRRDELERVFRQFGQCNVQLKRDGYGFVVFDFPPNAEKALRALKGKSICGELLTVTWSNKQPSTHFSRISRGGRRNANEFRRKTGFRGWSNQKMGRANSVVTPDEERGYRRDDFKDYIGEEKDYDGDSPDEGGGVIPKTEENDRWGEPVHDLVDNGNENAIEFDRYEPYQGHDKKYENEDYHVGYSGGSPEVNSPENVTRAHIVEGTTNRPNGSKFHQTCFRCGDPGHKMRNCPKEHSSQWRYNRLGVRQNSRIDKSHEDVNKFGYAFRMRLQSTGEALRMRHQRGGRRLSVSRETYRHQRKEYGEKKRSRNEMELPKRSKAKIRKRSVSSSFSSDFSESRSLSNSQSSKSLQKSSSRSRSRPVSSRSHSSSSKLRSLSVSLSSPSSSPIKTRSNSKSSPINGTAVETVDHLPAQGQTIGGNKMELENSKSKDTGVDVNGKAAAVYDTVVNDVEKNQFVQEDNHENHVFLKPSDRVTDLNEPPVENLSPFIVKGTKGLSHTGKHVLNPAPETNVNLHSDISTIVSMEEMHMVLNNYGLELPKDDENNLTVDAFFGCARLWPWHLVYYRKLKKGPISTENYARRVAQNQEFGIIDKYIRSSSGWGEFGFQNS